MTTDIPKHPQATPPKSILNKTVEHTTTHTHGHVHVTARGHISMLIWAPSTQSRGHVHLDGTIEIGLLLDKVTKPLTTRPKTSRET